MGDGIYGQWEPDEIVEPIAQLGEDVQQEILSQVTVIWPVSQALTYIFLTTVPDALKCLHPHQIPEWVGALLDSYESEGLNGARRFVADVEKNFVCLIRGESGLQFDKASRRLLPYARALAGREVLLSSSNVVRTDTRTLHLPDSMEMYPGEEENLLAYKLIVAQQCAYMEEGTFYPGRQAAGEILSGLPEGPEPGESRFWLDEVLSRFRERELALAIYHLMETARLETLLRTDLPGLMRDTDIIRQRLLELRASPLPGELRNQVLEGMRQWVLNRSARIAFAPAARECFARAERELEEVSRPGQTVDDSVQGTLRLYPCIEALPGTTIGEPLLYQGHIDTSAIRTALETRRQECRKIFIETMAALLAKTSAERETRVEHEAPEVSRPPLIEESATATPIIPGKERERLQQKRDEEERAFIQLGESRFELPDEIKALVREITSDLGEIPEEYVSSALNMAGPSGGYFEPPAEENGAPLSGQSVYPEWDFRRHGFRKNWCHLLEKGLDPVGGTFVADTLQKYGGAIHHLRRQFELMRTQDRYLKRQKDGDDVDLDAVVEALSDMRAGIEPSERLFVRLVRDERSIAAAFLVDMSASTEGWISTALKEALVLMCEALQVLGDRYSIYGFSGMRRTRSELFRIKSLEEPYGDTVKGRIAAVSAKDYTRMGPPIRHLTSLLQGVEAKVRLLITLSDGKPEDYDDYKGRYAVEDTRHALIEAKAAGIHPFCITIDQNAQEYISHMYGEVNYIFIDEVRKLPLRIPEIYRTLTT